jgi:hypothetical protein
MRKARGMEPVYGPGSAMGTRKLNNSLCLSLEGTGSIRAGQKKRLLHF